MENIILKTKLSNRIKVKASFDVNTMLLKITDMRIMVKTISKTKKIDTQET